MHLVRKETLYAMMIGSIDVQIELCKERYFKKIKFHVQRNSVTYHVIASERFYFHKRISSLLHLRLSKNFQNKLKQPRLYNIYHNCKPVYQTL